MKKLTLSLLCAISAIVPAVYAEDVLVTNDVEGVLERKRPDYVPNGISLGGFDLMPSISLQSFYNDNIFADANNEKEDFVTLIRPSAVLRSNWNNHQLYFGANGTIAKYADYSNEDYNEYSAFTGGRVDILRSTWISGKVTTSELHEDRSSPDDANGIEPTKYRLHQADMNLHRDQGKFKLDLSGTGRRYQFEDTKTLGGSIDNRLRDRNIVSSTARVGYEFIPNYEAFIRGTVDDVQYDEVGTFNRDSNGLGVVAGTALNLTGKAKGEVYAGYLTREYDDPQFSSIDALAYGANLLWNVTTLTSVRFDVDRTVQETTQFGASGYLQTASKITVEHELLRNLLLSADVGYTNDDYEQSIISGVNRDDDILLAGADAKYMIHRGITLGLAYDYYERDSNVNSEDFSMNRLMATLGAAF